MLSLARNKSVTRIVHGRVVRCGVAPVQSVVWAANIMCPDRVDGGVGLVDIGGVKSGWVGRVLIVRVDGKWVCEVG